MLFSLDSGGWCLRWAFCLYLVASCLLRCCFVVLLLSCAVCFVGFGGFVLFRFWVLADVVISVYAGFLVVVHCGLVLIACLLVVLNFGCICVCVTCLLTLSFAFLCIVFVYCLLDS